MDGLEWNDYDDFKERHWSNDDTWAKIGHIWQLLNGIGLHLEKDLVDADMLYKLSGYEVIRLWERYKDVLDHIGKETNRPEFMHGFRYLYGEMKKCRTSYSGNP